jgi:hypothetical protein
MVYILNMCHLNNLKVMQGTGLITYLCKNIFTCVDIVDIVKKLREYNDAKDSTHFSLGFVYIEISFIYIGVTDIDNVICILDTILLIHSNTCPLSR